MRSKLEFSWSSLVSWTKLGFFRRKKQTGVGTVLFGTTLRKLHVLLKVLGGFLVFKGVVVLILCWVGLVLLDTVPTIFLTHSLPENYDGRSLDEGAIWVLDRCLEVISTSRSLLILVLMAFSVYAASNIWLGAAVFMGQRWGRKLLIASRWAWLFVTFGQTVALVVWSFATFRSSHLSEPYRMETMAGYYFLMVASLIFWAMPALPGVCLIFCLSRPSVKLTCDQLDANPAWTDVIPIRHLIVSILFSVCAVAMMLLTLAIVGTQSPSWKSIMSAAPGLTGSILFFFCAWVAARMDSSKWHILFWGGMVPSGLACLFFLRADFIPILSPLADGPLMVIEEFSKPVGGIHSHAMNYFRSLWVYVATIEALILIYLLFTKKSYQPTMGSASSMG